RFRNGVFTPRYVAPELSRGSSGAIYLDSEGGAWLAPYEGGLYWQKGGQSGQVKEDGLEHDVVYSLTGSKGELWIGRQQGGLTRLKYDGTSFKPAETYTSAQGLSENSVYIVLQSRDRSIWAGSLMSGVTHLRNGKLTTYTTADGLASNT